MYKVHLILNVNCKDGTMTVEPTIELPFPPYPGLKLESHREATFMPEFAGVFWDMREQAFVVVCEDEHFPGDEKEALAMLAWEGWVTATEEVVPAVVKAE